MRSITSPCIRSGRCVGPDAFPAVRFSLQTLSRHPRSLDSSGSHGVVSDRGLFRRACDVGVFNPNYRCLRNNKRRRTPQDSSVSEHEILRNLPPCPLSRDWVGLRRLVPRPPELAIPRMLVLPRILAIPRFVVIPRLLAILKDLQLPVNRVNRNVVVQF